MSGAKAYYLKFDLTKNALKELPELEQITRKEAAIRTCLILSAHGSWDRSERLTVARPFDTHWNVIKIPAIEGTELWIVPDSAQVNVEKRVGFEKSSQPLLCTLAMHFMRLAYRDPIYRHEIRLEWKSDVKSNSWSGLSVMSGTAGFSMEQLEMTRDLGSIAFEE